MDETLRPDVDRLLGGQLPPDEQRRLAREALDDPELFELLTASALIDSTIGSEPQRIAAAAQRAGGSASSSRWRRASIAGLALAASIALVVYVQRGRTPAAPGSAPPPQTTARAVGGAAQFLLPPDAASAAKSFRSDAPAARSPLAGGAVVAVRGVEVDLDLGSIDGLAPGVDLEAGADARIRLTTVFRERSRGRIVAGRVRQDDPVAVPVATHVGALLDASAAREAAGDLLQAAALAEAARRASDQSDPGVVLRRRVRLASGRLARESGNAADAALMLERVRAEFDVPPVSPSDERVDTLEQLGAAEIGLGDYAAARRTLQQLSEISSGTVKARTANNLGALAAIGGDAGAAQQWYAAAQSALQGVSDPADARRVIDANQAATAAAPSR